MAMGRLWNKTRRRLFPYKVVNDEYITALSIANAGASMLPLENVYCFDYALKRLPPEGAVVEIGSFAGISTNAIIYFLRKNNCNHPFFTCDKWDFESGDQYNCMYALKRSYSEYCQFIREAFIRNVKFFSSDRLPYTLEMLSDDFFLEWRRSTLCIDVFGRNIKTGGKISFAYVDGNHQYEFVKRDFQNLNDFMMKGGFIFFDDSADHYRFGSSALMKEIRKRRDYELVMKNPNYLWRKIHE